MLHQKPSEKTDTGSPEICCECGRVRTPGDWKWEWLQVIPLNFKVGEGLKPLCPVCNERINAQHLADQIEEDWPE